MPTPIQRESATIHQFPRGGRAGLREQRLGTAAVYQPASLRVAAALDGSWYHEEAIKEADHGRKN